MIHPLRMIQLGTLLNNRLIRRLPLRPHIQVIRRSVAPRTAIVLAAVVGAPVRHRLLSCRADAVQIVGQMIRVQRSLHRHHPAADVHPNRSGK
jgi:hypothetical protein